MGQLQQGPWLPGHRWERRAGDRGGGGEAGCQPWAVQPSRGKLERGDDGREGLRTWDTITCSDVRDLRARWIYLPGSVARTPCAARDIGTVEGPD